MAFVQSPLPQEQQNQFSPSGQTTPNPMALLPPQATQTGGSAGQGGGAQAGTAPSVGTPTQFGSNASKLSDYLKANQDQVQNMANSIAGNLGTQYNTVKSGIDTAGQTFGSQVSGGYTPTDPTLLSQVQSNPVEVAKDQNAVSSFQKQLNDQYTGPTSFESSDVYGGVQKNVNDAVQQAQLLGSYPGLSGYLQNNVEVNATPGQNTLDTVLLQGNQPAFQTVQNAAKPFSNLSDYLGTVAQNQNQSVAAAKAAAPAAQQAAQAALVAPQQALTTGLNNELTSAQGNYQSYGKKLNDLISQLSQTATTIPQSVWAANKVDPRLSSTLSDISNFNMYDPNESFSVPQGATFLTPAAAMPGAPTMQDVATQGDVDTAQALALLSGGTYSPPVTAAGKYSMPDLPTIDQSAMGSSLYNLINNTTPSFTGAQNPNAALTQYQAALANLQSYLGLPLTTPQQPVLPPGPQPTLPPGSGLHSGGGGQGGI